MKTIIEKIKWQERIKEYLTDGRHDLVTLEHEAIVVIRDDKTTVHTHKPVTPPTTPS